MRIEAYTQVQQLYNSSKTAQNQKTAKAKGTDKVQISSTGKDYQTARSAVMSTPDIREEITAPIKEKIQNGTYSVSNDSFAEKLLQNYDEMR